MEQEEDQEEQEDKEEEKEEEKEQQQEPEIPQVRGACALEGAGTSPAQPGHLPVSGAQLSVVCCHDSHDSHGTLTLTSSSEAD